MRHTHIYREWQNKKRKLCEMNDNDCNATQLSSRFALFLEDDLVDLDLVDLLKWFVNSLRIFFGYSA